MRRLDSNEFRRLLEAKHNELLSTTSDRDDIVIESTADEMDRLQQQLSREVAIRNLAHRANAPLIAAHRVGGHLFLTLLLCDDVFHDGPAG